MSEHLMAVSEIRRRLGLSRQRAYQLTREPHWPAPYDVLAVGKVWRREDIEAWIVRHRPADALRAEGWIEPISASDHRSTLRRDPV
jgi:predicted DNA-binding transcriptional regulator AlpA